jgi:GrpB-like predicted nucleotidyltransferase (UPF0157 family)
MKNLKKYTFRKYSEKFPVLFRKERAKLRKILPKAKIEHIGSSAVKGLGGKGIIDIILAVPKKDFEKTLPKLEREGYVYIAPEHQRERDRKYLQRIIKHRGDERRVHVHLTWENSKNWKTKIALRDYLRKHRDVAKKYAAIKKKGVKFARGEGAKYREFKHSFLLELNKKAMKEFRG